MELNPTPLNSKETSSSNSSANPFVGLRPFLSTEGLLFFGRREQVVELLQQLHSTHFLAVVGSSGSGKSSLIRAGLIPKLKAGFLVGRRDEWRMAIMRPGDSPLQNLVIALMEAFSEKATDERIKALLKAVEISGLKAIIDYLTPHLEKSDTNVLLLIDQFEEIFRFGFYADKDAPHVEADDKEKRRAEAADFVSIMLGLAQQQALPVYVVMTMRSDFLGDCDAFYRLPEAMNRSQYLVPRLTRQQRQEAIESPIRLYGEEIASRLLDRVLNDVGEEPDQLPVMQHALMRTWEKWREEKNGSIDLNHYKAVGTIKDALSQDADKALSGMSDEEMIITERIFQALTEIDARGRRGRRPAHLSELQAITGASREKVLEIIQRFRSNNREFLTLSEDRLKGDPLVDISHESLIRQWETLRKWLDDEAEFRELYLRLAGEAVRYPTQASLLSDPALQLALDWKEKRQPNQAWGERYHPEFARAMDFLDESREKRERDAAEAELLQKEKAERERKKLEEKAGAHQRELEKQIEEARRIRRFMLVFLVLMMLALTAASYAFITNRKAIATQEADQAHREATKYLERVDIEKARETFLDAINKYENIPNPDGVAHTYTELGRMLIGQTKQEGDSQQQEGVAYYNKAIDNYRLRGDFDGSAAALAELGVFLGKKDNKGIRFNDEELYEYQNIEKIDIRESTKTTIGYFCEALGDYEKAENLEGQISILSKIRDVINSALSDAKDNQAMNEWLESLNCNGKKIESDPIKYYEQIVPLFERLIQQQAQNQTQVQKQQAAFVSMLIKIGKSYQQQHNEPEAAEMFEQAISVYNNDGKHKEEADTLKTIGNIYFKEASQLQIFDLRYPSAIEQNYRKALEYYNRALLIYESPRDSKNKAGLLMIIGEMQYYLKLYDESLASFRSVLPLFEAENDPTGQGRAYGFIGKVHAKTNKTQEANDSYNKALNIFQKTNDEARIKSVQISLNALKNKAKR